MSLGRATSERKNLQPVHQVNPEIQTLTIKNKELFRYFTTSQLEMSRLGRLKGYQQLIQELKDFNEELTKWKNNRHEIKNIVVTYHLYENLFSRLKVSSC